MKELDQADGKCLLAATDERSRNQVQRVMLFLCKVNEHIYDSELGTAGFLFQRFGVAFEWYATHHCDHCRSHYNRFDPLFSIEQSGGFRCYRIPSLAFASKDQIIN